MDPSHDSLSSASVWITWNIIAGSFHSSSSFRVDLQDTVNSMIIWWGKVDGQRKRKWRWRLKRWYREGFNFYKWLSDDQSTTQLIAVSTSCLYNQLMTNSDGDEAMTVLTIWAINVTVCDHHVQISGSGKLLPRFWRHVFNRSGKIASI